MHKINNLKELHADFVNRFDVILLENQLKNIKDNNLEI